VAKRRSRKQADADPMVIVYLIVLLLGLAAIVAVIREAELHPVAAGFVVFLIASAGGIGGVLWWKRRQRIAAEHEAYWQAQYELQVARSREIAPYHQMSPKEFEQALAFLCERDGCTQVVVVGGAGDLGADVKAIAPDGRLIVLQAKRYGPTTKVSGPDLQKFGGTCFNVHGAHVAAVVTTASFTKQAREYAHHMGIGLFDEHALAAWASRTGPAPWH
jgi:restriction system protein